MSAFTRCTPQQPLADWHLVVLESSSTVIEFVNVVHTLCSAMLVQWQSVSYHNNLLLDQGTEIVIYPLSTV